MRLARVHVGDRYRAAILGEDKATLLDAEDVGALLSAGWQPNEAPSHDTVGLEEVTICNPLPRPEKIVCVGLNFHDHAIEAGMHPTEYPILFAKYWRSLIG